MRLMASAFFLALALFAAPTPLWASNEGGGESEGGEAGESNFVSLQPMLVPVLQENHLRGMMTVTVNLYLNDAARRAEIENLRPKLTDRYLIALNQLGRATIDPDRPLNYKLLERVLQRSTDTVLGADVARVLIVDASTRPM